MCSWIRECQNITKVVLFFLSSIFYIKSLNFLCFLLIESVSFLLSLVLTNQTVQLLVFSSTCSLKNILLLKLYQLFGDL